MKHANSIAIGILCTFFILVFAISLLFNRNYPVLIIAGESSVGTWMSGVLLIISATTSLITGMRKGWFPWFLLAIFFFVLSLDERFMFHERLKERIIFSLHPASRWIYELPVIVGGCIGAIVAFKLWLYLQKRNRLLLLCAAILGCTSVLIDIMAAGVVWEECSKLLAELSIACALLQEVNLKEIKNERPDV